MNRGRGGNRRGGGGGGRTGGGGSGGRHYVPRGQSPRPAYHYVVRRVPNGAAAHCDNPSSRSESSIGTGSNSEIASVDGVTKKFDGLLSPDYAHSPNPVPCGVGNVSPKDGNSKQVHYIPEAEQKPSNARTPKITQSWDQHVEYSSPANFSCTPPVDAMHKTESSSSTAGRSLQEVQSGKDEVESSDSQHKGFSFDICEERNMSIPQLKPSLQVKNRALRNEKSRMQGDNIKILRPGMILLKGYISLMDQVKLIKSCRDLGRGPGGFYQPSYSDGAMLHLKMMCLGKNWDPETSMYGDIRPVDQAEPPIIPNEFQRLVKDAIQDCHGYLESVSKVKNARSILPSMSPNICIINYYTKTGKLGLHQDKDESQESLRKGLPVVSISLGDTAEFLYGDERDIDKADKVLLESGDVLIFGGKSRHIFHGVNTIKPETAPKSLLDETHLRPGRLNLTFREY